MAFGLQLTKHLLSLLKFVGGLLFFCACGFLLLQVIPLAGGYLEHSFSTKEIGAMFYGAAAIGVAVALYQIFKKG